MKYRLSSTPPYIDGPEVIVAAASNTAGDPSPKFAMDPETMHCTISYMPPITALATYQEWNSLAPN